MFAGLVYIGVEVADIASIAADGCDRVTPPLFEAAAEALGPPRGFVPTTTY